MKAVFSVALVHYPVYDKNRLLVATAVTNLDIHDIARAARTFGADRYYIVTPVEGQQSLTRRVADHWQSGWGATYNPKRKAALDILQVVSDLESAVADMKERTGRIPKLVVTGATGRPGSVSSMELAGRLAEDNGAYLLVFGTGWGLTEKVFDSADLVLEPILGSSEYNHLSVRSAVSIYLDRLFGRT